MPPYLSSTVQLQGGGSVVAWAIEEDNQNAAPNLLNDDKFDLEIRYCNHRVAGDQNQTTSSAVYKLSRRGFELDYDGDELDSQLDQYSLVWDTFMEWLDDVGVDSIARPAAVDAIVDGCAKVADSSGGSLVKLIVSIQVGSSEKMSHIERFQGVSLQYRGHVGGAQTCCAICLEDMGTATGSGPDDVELARLPCSHVFHGACIVGWVRKCGASSITCPLCRFALCLENNS